MGIVLAAPSLVVADTEKVDLLSSRLERQFAMIEALDAEFRSLEERLGRPLAVRAAREDEVRSAPREEVAVEEEEPVVPAETGAEPEPELVASAGEEEESDPEPEVEPTPEAEPDPPAVGTAPRRAMPGLDEIETELGADDSGRFHIVQPGDTLSRIAETYGFSLQNLLDANPNVDPRRLRPGQRVRLPATPAAGLDATAIAAVDGPEDGKDVEDANDIDGPAARPPARPATHVVVAGETLSSIAARYQTTVEVLMELNAITDPRRLQAGQTLLLPRNGGEPGDPEARVEVLVDEEEEARPRLYTVRPGDTLARIGAREGISVERIRQLNPGIDGDRIYPGQVFRLRADVPIEETRMRPNPGATAIPQVEQTFGLYRVREGDSLTSVARDFFVSRDEIANWNDLDRDATLRTGQSLRLPQSVIEARAAQQDGR